MALADCELVLERYVTAAKAIEAELEEHRAEIARLEAELAELEAPAKKKR
jgi:hypothetical protein